MHSTVEVNDGVSREPARYKKFQKTRIHSNVLPHWILLTVNNSRKRLLRERMVDAAHLVFKRPFVAFLLLFHKSLLIVERFVFRRIFGALPMPTFRLSRLTLVQVRVFSSLIRCWLLCGVTMRKIVVIFGGLSCFVEVLVIVIQAIKPGVPGVALVVGLWLNCLAVVVMGPSIVNRCTSLTRTSVQSARVASGISCPLSRRIIDSWPGCGTCLRRSSTRSIVFGDH